MTDQLDALVMRLVLDPRVNVSSNVLLVLNMVCRRLNADGFCSLTQAALAEESRLSAWQVQRALATLAGPGHPEHPERVLQVVRGRYGTQMAPRHRNLYFCPSLTKVGLPGDSCVLEQVGNDFRIVAVDSWVGLP